ncbi:MAG: PAS domain-containing sensor histidine kinase, partial [Leptospirales bacterium]
MRTGQKKIIGVGREAIGVRKDGSEFPAYLSVSEVFDEGRRYFTGILHDITDLKEAEQKLAVERNFISAVLETAGAAVVVLDRNGRIVNFNRESQEISGYSFDEVYGRVIWDFLVPEEEIESTRKQFNSLMMGRFPNHYENSWLTKGGRERLIQWSNTALEGEFVDGRVEFVVGIGIDITDKRRSENDLSVLSRKIIEIQEDERNRIASEIHDVLGQSLIALKFMVDDVVYRLGEKDVAARDKLGEINEYINTAVQQARNISHNLSPIALKKIGLSHAIRELVNSFQAGTNYKIKLDLEAMDVFFRSRWEINIYRIIQESLTNIFKHAGATEIEIQARQIGNALLLKVKDNGVGYDREEVEAALEINKGDGGDADEADERGIGQLIMQERAALLGGHLKILSKKNQGTEIILEIPQ